jgi:hypothetical protein
MNQKSKTNKELSPMRDLNVGVWICHAIECGGAALKLSRPPKAGRLGEWEAELIWPAGDSLKSSAKHVDQALDDLEKLVLEDASSEVLKGEPNPDEA